MNRYRIHWSHMRTGSHNRRAIFSNVFGQEEVYADNQTMAKDIFRRNYPARIAGASEWYRIDKVEKL